MSMKEQGFTLIELITIILLLGILSVTAVVKWPRGFDQEAARMEMLMAVRYAQHYAMTRRFTGLGSAWGIVINPAMNQYSVVQRGTPPTCATPDYCNRQVLNDNIVLSTNITGDSIWFNGLGQPFYNNASDPELPAGSRIAIGPVGDCQAISVSPETGYAQGGSPCP